ncbi:MAG: dTDP-glucose 4,6-dehydratase [Nitrospinae bacterium]|nr:dTDP-glucose 4,6-dehydratase [Nitrospinota bacterium]
MKFGTVLVTGGAGFIGGNFVHMLINELGAKVINLDCLTYAGNMVTLEPVAGNPKHIFVKGDIRDRKLVRSLLAESKPEAIVNFAAESHVDRSIDSPGDFIQTNVLGSFELLEAARGHWGDLTGADRDRFRFLHVSTDEVYGSLGGTGLFNESSPYSPNSPYAASKAASDHLVRAYHHTYGLPAIITNCSNNYGPYQYPEKLIPLAIYKALSGKPIPVYGDGGNVRDWLYVKDHCHAIWSVLQKGAPGQTYNVGGNGERTNIQVVRAICKILDELMPDSPNAPHEKLITHVADRPGHDRRYAIDASKIGEQTGWAAKQTFEQGLKNTVIWYIENKKWADTVMAGEYKGERLGLAKGE